MIDAKSTTVNIKAIAKDLKARLGQNPVEDEWEVWARIPVEDVGQVLEMAPELCKLAPQLRAELGDVQEKLRYGAELRSVEVMTELLVAVNAPLQPASTGAQDGAEALKGRLAGLEGLATMCKEALWERADAPCHVSQYASSRAAK